MWWPYHWVDIQETWDFLYKLSASRLAKKNESMFSVTDRAGMAALYAGDLSAAVTVRLRDGFFRQDDRRYAGSTGMNVVASDQDGARHAQMPECGSGVLGGPMDSLSGWITVWLHAKPFSLFFRHISRIEAQSRTAMIKKTGVCFYFLEP
jgi:hypothetical protein